MKTVLVSDTKETWWDGKVIIDEIREFEDSRGTLAEVWRTDDEIMGEDANKSSMMCYVSETKPYVMRGPHQHSKLQCDFFYTFKNKMSYHLYNPETGEMKIYITDPNKITRVKVDSPIVHSYRNLEDFCINTSNYPTALFMGIDKKDPIDEIRWEDKYVKNQTVVILGAEGRLGKALTNYLYGNMGAHDYHVIPISKKLRNNDEVNDMFQDLDTALKDLDSQKILSKTVTIVNCAAYANVQNADSVDVEEIIEWSNVQLPMSLCRLSAQRGWRLCQISTDYVFQKLKDDAGIFAQLGAYTRSKKRMEQAFNDAPKNMTKDTTIFRVANLFSANDGKKHNMIKKFDRIKRNGKKFTVAPDVRVFPSDAESVAEVIGLQLINDHGTEFLRFINIVPDNSYTLDKFLEIYFDVTEFGIYDSDVVPWHEGFTTINKDRSYINRVDGIVYFKSDKQSILDIIKRGEQLCGN